MKVVMISKALVSGAYQKKTEELAALPDISLVAVVPPSWREPNVGTIRLERSFTSGYRMEVLPIIANGHHHFFWFTGLQRLLKREQPDVVHIDEESFNVATFLAIHASRAVGAQCCFFNWANIDRWYPPPFCFFERYAFRHAAYAIAGNQEAADIMRRHGYGGRLVILPQFGVDPTLFTPAPTPNSHTLGNPFVVGYVGRLIARKGIRDLVEAIADLPDHVHLHLVGDGDMHQEIVQQAQETSINHRIVILPAVQSTAVPAVLQTMDVLVLPSRTERSWKEQFGRILIEAMSCGVPVVGSSSGEIPNVIGDAGLVFPEGDSNALRATLLRLLQDNSLRETLRRRGRERVQQHYTQAALARRYYEVYREMCGVVRRA